MEPATLFTLLNDVVKYYSIGQRIIPAEYQGYKNWEETVRKKFYLIQSGTHHPWLDVLSAFEQKRFVDDDTIDCSSFQFPSLTLRLVLDRFSFSDVKRERTFVLDLSLLSPFYSAYVEDRFVVGPALNLEQYVPGKNYSLHNLSTQHPEFSGLKTIAEKVIPSVYSGYQFIDHYHLFQHKIDNIQTYNVIPGELKSRTLYNILFSDYHQGAEGFTYRVTS
ncbi:hypothetical protein [Chitinophaga sp. YIM B06452]|uniref:hypothetical protein n=1 Tax=Chitinophaga sp. YIM B06452 TaxID=3082158 RepID=UPI0031FEBD6A